MGRRWHILIPITLVLLAPIVSTAQELVMTPDPLVIFPVEFGEMLITPSPPAAQTIVIDLHYSDTNVASGPLTLTIPVGDPNGLLLVQAGSTEGPCTITASTAGYADGFGNVVVVSPFIFSDDFETGDILEWSTSTGGVRHRAVGWGAFTAAWGNERP